MILNLAVFESRTAPQTGSLGIIFNLIEECAFCLLLLLIKMLARAVDLDGKTIELRVTEWKYHGFMPSDHVIWRENFRIVKGNQFEKVEGSNNVYARARASLSPSSMVVVVVGLKFNLLPREC